MATDQARNFACELYPESMPDNVWELIENLHIPIAVSPVHDRDCTEDGELKKPHYHVMCCLDGKKSVSTIRKIFKSFGGVGCEVIVSKKSYGRYLCHLDEDHNKKALYDVNGIKYFGGIELDLTANGSKGVLAMVTELKGLIEKFQCSSPWDLIEVLISENKSDLLQYVQDHAYFVKSFLL